MTQADSVHSTPPTNTSVDRPQSSRRGFLIQAAGVAAGGAALGMALPLPVSAGSTAGVPDPILEAIEAHKAARAVVYSAVAAVAAAEKQIRDKGVKLSAARGNDARLDSCEDALHRAFEAETDAACVLVTEVPTTMAGVLALLAYANAADTDGEGWPDSLYADDSCTKTRSWHFFLIERLAETLPGLVRA